jgi:hypothetical protein
VQAICQQGTSLFEKATQEQLQDKAFVVHLMELNHELFPQLDDMWARDTDIVLAAMRSLIICGGNFTHLWNNIPIDLKNSLPFFPNLMGMIAREHLLAAAPLPRVAKEAIISHPDLGSNEELALLALQLDHTFYIRLPSSLTDKQAFRKKALDVAPRIIKYFEIEDRNDTELFKRLLPKDLAALEGAGPEVQNDPAIAWFCTAVQPHCPYLPHTMSALDE